MAEHQLPTLAELHHDPQEAFKYDKYLLFVNQSPHDKWIKKHPIYGNKYIPIDKIEFMLDRIFQQHYTEILREGIMANAVYVTIRLHLKHPHTGEWFYQDGIGAHPLQLDQGAEASDLSKIKSEAVMIGLPIAESRAIRDATDKLGKLFGRDLNRKDTLRFAAGYIIDSEEKDETPPLPKKPSKQDDPIRNLLSEDETDLPL